MDIISLDEQAYVDEGKLRRRHQLEAMRQWIIVFTALLDPASLSYCSFSLPVALHLSRVHRHGCVPVKCGLVLLS